MLAKSKPFHISNEVSEFVKGYWDVWDVRLSTEISRRHFVHSLEILFRDRKHRETFLTDLKNVEGTVGFESGNVRATPCISWRNPKNARSRL